MNSFLYRVAKKYYDHYSSNINEFTFVFPNRRAGLFFQQHLAIIANKPLFSPEIITVNNCFSMASNWQAADRISLLFKLYTIYLEKSKSDESFDSFVFWGEMLLSDFDDIDKYRVDAKQLFTNITELKEIDQLFNIFTEKQVEAIREFWSNFVPVVEGKSQEDFISTWKILFPIYQQLREELIAQELATEGMICRDVADRLRKKETIGAFENKQFVFVGFNALNPCERSLFAELQKTGQADFYWDYEAAELRDDDNQASRFYAENIHIFPSKHPINPIIESIQDKEIELIAVPSDIGQAKEVFAILNKLHPSENLDNSWINTAVVLPNESLLIPLLHSFPAQIEKINITMGFPLKATPASGLIDLIFELQKRIRISGEKQSFYHINVSAILNHQYIAMLCGNVAEGVSKKMADNNWIYIDANELKKNELLAAIFTPQSDPLNLLAYLLHILKNLQTSWQLAATETQNYQLECDFLYQYYITINRMVEVLKKKPLNVSVGMDTLIRMTKQVVAGISVPFLGEPLDGLQVMGVLETRGLDFENLIITSFNEGVFPTKSSNNSFIPYNLRRGFELPTTEHQDAITAYNFYRLIHRAKRIFFLYDSRTEGMQTGEVSRFFHQMNYHYGVNFVRKSISYDVSFATHEPLEIAKTPIVMAKLQRFVSSETNTSGFSASSINCYIDCPLQFYLTRVERIKESDEIVETVESNMFGTIFHSVLEHIYEPFVGKTILSCDIESLLKNTLHIDKIIEKSFSENFYKKKNGNVVALEGNELLIGRVIRKYVLQVLRIDKERTPFGYIHSEKNCTISFPIKNGKLHVNIGGFIDRVDEKDGQIRITDYKTGVGELEFKSIENLFEHNARKRPKHILQTFLYGVIYKEFANGKRITPSILFMRNVFRSNFQTEIIYKPESKVKEPVIDFAVFEKKFCDELTLCLNEIFDEATPFIQTENTDICKYCPYVGVCNR